MADRVQEAPEEAVETPASAPAKPNGGFKSFLPLIITVVLMPAAAWAMTRFVLIPKLQKSLGIAPAHVTSSAEQANASTNNVAGEKAVPKQTHPLTKLLVNVAGTMGSRYLLASVTLAGSAPDFKARIENSEPQLRDAAMTLLSTKTITDLEKPGARNIVRSELINGFNNVLGGGTVQEIYITEFAIQ
jgi:flagellar FliL protein